MSHVDSDPAGCQGKQGFDTRDEAVKAMPRNIKTRGRGKIKPYRCKTRGKWHIGSGPLA